MIVQAIKLRRQLAHHHRHGRAADAIRPLDTAISWQYPEKVLLLLRAGADPSLRSLRHSRAKGRWVQAKESPIERVRRLSDSPVGELTRATMERTLAILEHTPPWRMRPCPLYDSEESSEDEADSETSEET